MASKVDAATIVVAALREQVAALHTAADPTRGTDPADPLAPEDKAGDSDSGTDSGVTSIDARATDVEGEVAPGGADQRLALRDAAAGLDALLVGLGPVLDAAATDPLHTELTWVRETLDPLVAADAAGEFVDDLLDELDPTLVVGPITARLSLAERERERGAAPVLADLLASSRWAELVERADRLVIDAPLVGKADKGAKSVLTRLLAEQDREMAAALSDLDDADDPVTRGAERDRVVTAGTRVSELAEVTRVVHGKHARSLAEATRAVVEAADDYATATAGGRLVVDLADRAHRAGEPGFSYGRLHATADLRREDALDDLAHAEKKWAKPKRHKWLQD